MDQFAREVAGALKNTIDAHGPIAEENLSSAAKRIASALREAIKRERDELMTTTPRKPRGSGGEFLRSDL